MKGCFVIWLHPSFYSIISFNMNSVKSFFYLLLINAIVFYYRHRIKVSAHLELKQTKNITHFLLLKAHTHWRF